MSALGTTSPAGETLITAEARKSFSFALWIKDHAGRMLNITDCTIRIIVKKPRYKSEDDTDNLILNSEADLVSPTHGYARFNLQASDLDHKPGEYPYSIVLWDGGYSSVLAKGVLDLRPNTEFDSSDLTYSPDQPVTAMQVMMRGRVSVEVRAGSTLAPGSTTFLVTDKAKLDSIEAGAQKHIPADWNEPDPALGGIANKPLLGSAAFRDVEELSVPPGGSPGEMLVKLSASNYHVGWAQPPAGGGGAGLDPTGVLAGRVPTANGANGWSWEEPAAKVESVNGQIGAVVLNQDSVADTPTRVAMTPAERAKLDELTVTTEWADVLNKPAFGSASLLDAADVLLKGQINASTDFASGTVPNARLPRVSAMPGFSSGTTPPVGGADGDLYFQYT